MDCPFTGSRLPAEKGELVYYAGTDSSTLTACGQYWNTVPVTSCTWGIGAGTVVKLVTNMVSATMVQSLSKPWPSPRHTAFPSTAGAGHFPERHRLPWRPSYAP
ncbi:MAG: hypothetical protein ACLT8E_11105 [Akkermansia sp.]